MFPLADAGRAIGRTPKGSRTHALTEVCPSTGSPNKNPHHVKFVQRNAISGAMPQI